MTTLVLDLTSLVKMASRTTEAHQPNRVFQVVGTIVLTEATSDAYTSWIALEDDTALTGYEKKQIRALRRLLQLLGLPNHQLSGKAASYVLSLAQQHQLCCVTAGTELLAHLQEDQLALHVYRNVDQCIEYTTDSISRIFKCSPKDLAIMLSIRTVIPRDLFLRLWHEGLPPDVLLAELSPTIRRRAQAIVDSLQVSPIDLPDDVVPIGRTGYSVDVVRNYATCYGLETATLSRRLTIDVLPLPYVRDVPSLNVRTMGVYRPDLPTRVVLVDDLNVLDTLVHDLSTVDDGQWVAFDTETDSEKVWLANLVGISIAPQTGKAYYIPVGHRIGKQLPLDVVLRALKCHLECPTINWVAHNAKFDCAIMLRYGIWVHLGFDTMIGAFITNPDKRGIGLKDQIKMRLGVEMTRIGELVDLKTSNMSYADIQRTAAYAGDDAARTLDLCEPIYKELADLNLLGFYYAVELPLVPVLVDMELSGMLVDQAFLHKFGNELEATLNQEVEKVNQLLGKTINLRSAKQLATVLYDELKLTPPEKTKSGGDSVGTYALWLLSDQHAAIDHIQEYRTVQKLLSVYIEGMLKLVQPDGKVHTQFLQAVARTGRTSSVKPNMQNLPAKSAYSKQIRKAFVAPLGWKIIAIDFSGIEMRILAHCTSDPKLLHIFTNNLDVHAITASRLYEIPESEITGEQRRVGKTTNFSTLYGQGPKGLARLRRISEEDATEFIRKYHMMYPSIKVYSDSMVEFARQHGYVQSVFGRKRFISDLDSTDRQLRRHHERVATNTPIQATGSDIIKLSMIVVWEELRRRRLQTRMLLTVHDEIVFVSPDAEVEIIHDVVVPLMENIVQLKVPLKVDFSVAQSWGDCE